MENACYEEEYTCLSFSSYSSDKLTEIALKVAAENINGGDEEFEFSLVTEFSGENFEYDGQIGSIFPLFNRDLLRRDGGEKSQSETAINVPLGELLFGDREDYDRDNSCSSSESDELENIPAGTYCVWRPKAAPASPTMCTKSRSAGSASKRWKFSDLLRRSNSEGSQVKDSFVFLTPKNRVEKIAVPEKSKGKGVNGAVSKPLEALYVRNRTIKEGDKKKSFLPYRTSMFSVNIKMFG